jgi:hypothetical protein
MNFSLLIIILALALCLAITAASSSDTSDVAAQRDLPPKPRSRQMRRDTTAAGKHAIR